MKEIIISILCVAYTILFLWDRISSIILFFKIRKYKKFLESACPFGNNKITCNYSDFREYFYLVIKLLRNNKNYNVVSLFGQYLLAIKETLDFEFYKSNRGIETTDDMLWIEKTLNELGYSSTAWCLVCNVMDGDEKADEMILKQLYWWPAFCLKFNGEKFVGNSMKHLHTSDDEAVMNRIMAFTNDLRIFKNVQNHLSVSESTESNVLIMEKALIKFLKDALQNKYLTFGDLQKIQKEVMANSFTNGVSELLKEKSSISAEINARISRMKGNLQKSSTLV